MAFPEEWFEKVLKSFDKENITNTSTAKAQLLDAIVDYFPNPLSSDKPIVTKDGEEVELEVTDTDPGFAGYTATNTLKPATLETGAVIKVPLFINIGDVLKIDTRTGEYLSRA